LGTLKAMSHTEQEIAFDELKSELAKIPEGTRYIDAPNYPKIREILHARLPFIKIDHRDELDELTTRALTEVEKAFNILKNNHSIEFPLAWKLVRQAIELRRPQ